jgi:Zn finger protein HypA/HybF involved in hydrogenase expression
MDLYSSVLQIYRELLAKKCNGYAKIRLGELVASPESFLNVFAEFSKGTPLEKTKLDFEIEKLMIKCSCGYFGSGIAPNVKIEKVKCPECNKSAKIVAGFGLKILVVK